MERRQAEGAVASEEFHGEMTCTYDTYVHPMQSEKQRAATLMGNFATGSPAPFPAPFEPTQTDTSGNSTR